MTDRTENRSSNRTNNCKNQSQNRTENRTDNRTENRATNEHKHPNQYTKGADDEDKYPLSLRKPAAFPALFSSAESSGLSRVLFLIRVKIFPEFVE